MARPAAPPGRAAATDAPAEARKTNEARKANGARKATKTWMTTDEEETP